MTSQELRELRELCNKATPGPWTVRSGHGISFVEAPKLDNRHPYNIEVLGEDETLYHTRAADLEFVARSRSLVPELLDEIERLKKYARHLHDCDAAPKYATLALPCTCGLVDTGEKS